MNNALIIFVKNPQLGKVKTRLAKTVGDEKALEIYYQLSEITRKNAVILRGVKCHLFYSDFIDNTDDWSNKNFNKHVQIGNDLGERMYNAFQKILSTADKACIIGSDCPTLSTSLLKKAFQSLEKNDSVIGPSTDGGYYLLGFNKKILNFAPILFENMIWSTENVLSETIKRLENHSKTYYLLPPLTDIDEEKDWNAYIQAH